MGTTAEKLQNIIDLKELIRLTINLKGVEVLTTQPLSDYANAISLISGGGTSFTVTYYDYDNTTILKQLDVLQGGDVNPPANPTRSNYKFTGWSGSSLNVLLDLTIVAQYIYAPNVVTFLDYRGTILDQQSVENGGSGVPPSITWENLVLNAWEDYSNITSSRVVSPQVSPIANKTTLYITLDANTGLSPTFYYWCATGSVTIDYGDGTSATSSTHGNTSLSHTYSSYGLYVVKFTATDAVIGQSTGNLSPVLSSTYKLAITKCLCSNTMAPTGYAFYQCNNLIDLSLHTTATAVLYNCFQEATSLEQIVLPSTVTTINASAFLGCSLLKKLVLKSTTKITLTNINALQGIHTSCKIYVPANLVDTYKNDATWSTYATQIYSIIDIT